jgi:2-amino-4-hydroxy-6-hydroxymethyldihydropteridine diphosphokinase
MQTVPCAIALGSNLGDSQQILGAALRQLDADAQIEVVACSQFYRTAPVGPPQPDYLNCCALLQTSLTPAVLLRRLLAVETAFGRVRRQRWGPRLLDLDLLLFGDWVIETPTLQVPHPRMRERAFVLVPLAEIAPDWIEPVSGKAISQLNQQVDPSGVYRLAAQTI